MERHIGVLKAMVALMSNVDQDLATKVSIHEHLNQLPFGPLYSPPSPPGRNEIYPFAPTERGVLHDHPTIISMETALKAVFGEFRGAYPMEAPDGDEVVLWKKYHVITTSQ